MTGRDSASAMVSFRGEHDIPRSNVRSLTGTGSRVRLWQGAFLGLKVNSVRASVRARPATNEKSRELAGSSRDADAPPPTNDGARRCEPALASTSPTAEPETSWQYQSQSWCTDVALAMHSDSRELHKGFCLLPYSRRSGSWRRANEWAVPPRMVVA